MEIVGAWTAVNGLLATMDARIYWGVFIVLGIFVPVYIWRFTSEADLPAAKWQIIGATGAYIAWVFAMGGPFTTIEGFAYQPAYGTIVLALYSVVLVLLLGKKPITP